MSDDHNALFPKITKACSSPSLLAHSLHGLLNELSNPLPLSHSAKATDQFFLDAVNEIITSKPYNPIQKFHCLYLLLKVTELPDKSIFMTRLAAKDELLRYIFHTSQTEMAKGVYFNERGRTFFDKNSGKVQQQQGINFVRLAYEIIIYWGDKYGNSDSNHALYIFHFLGESLKKKCKLPLRFCFLQNDFDIECDLSTWNFRQDDPPMTCYEKNEKSQSKRPEEEVSLRVLQIVSNTSNDVDNSRHYEPLLLDFLSQPRQTSGSSDLKYGAESTPRKSPMNLTVRINNSFTLREPERQESIVKIEPPKINVLQVNGSPQPQQASYKLTISQCEERTPEVRGKEPKSQGFEMDLLNIGEEIKRSYGSFSVNGSSISQASARSITSPAFGSQGNLDIQSRGSECVSVNSFGDLSSRKSGDTSLRDDSNVLDNSLNNARMTFGAGERSMKSPNFGRNDNNLLGLNAEEINNRKRKSMYLGSAYLDIKSNTNQNCLNQSFSHFEGNDQNNKKYDPFVRSPLPEHRIPGQYNIRIGTTPRRDERRMKSPYKY